MTTANFKTSLRSSGLGSKCLGIRLRAVLCTFLLALFLLSPALVHGQDVTARVSSREAWVGSPIVLQLQIRNAENYSPPNDFEIDGCDVRSAGTPSQSSQITIINGRRSESRSVTMQYLITPRREGKFQIPALEVEVDRITKKTRAITFVANKSETGDLLFVEVEGEKESVFVGQPLDIKLKIWVKPFTDRKSEIKLNEGHMWQLLSGQTSWGVFTERMQEIEENRQRPGGKSVLREDGEGQSREYFLYEITGTIYPTKPGKIDATDLQVVIDYPLALGRRRDPFDSFFDDTAFGSNSLMRDMMGSSFGRRLTVAKSRPVVADAKVNSTEVLPVPIEGQPADYRGAVGQYKIVAKAEPLSVAAGDPITLQLGIVGDGPMELVQAPPLHEIDSLSNDFQVTDQSLAGFVQNDSKVFVTAIRPKSEEVTQIPPIPFSFFDPDAKSYQTVYTDPIDIEVEKAESLGLDAIVSNARQADSSTDDSNDATNSLVGLQDTLSRYAATAKHWWYMALIPPVCLLMLYFGKFAFAAPALVASMKSPMSRARQSIDRASEESELVPVLQQYVAEVTHCECPSFEHAVGNIRSVRDYETARRMEALYDQIARSSQIKRGLVAQESSATLATQKTECGELLEAIDLAWRNRRKRN